MKPLYILLSQVFLETLRMHPPAPATLREAPEGLSLSGYEIPRGTMVMVRIGGSIIESVDSICRDSADTQYMLIQTNFSKSPKQLTYKPL